MEENLNTNGQMSEQTENNCGNKEGKKCGCKCFQTVLNVVLLAAVAVLFILHFCHRPKTVTPWVGNTGTTSGVTVGFVDTDSLIDQYQFAIELNEKMNQYKQLEENYKIKMTKFQEDYNNYLKTGANMTLTEQKKNEESLKKRADELQRLENQILKEQGRMETVVNVDQKKMIEAVYAFIADYNAKHQKFTVIMKKSFSESPVLYIDSTLDITREIIDGLNEEYKEYKKSEK